MGRGKRFRIKDDQSWAKRQQWWRKSLCFNHVIWHFFKHVSLSYCEMLQAPLPNYHATVGTSVHIFGLFRVIWGTQPQRQVMMKTLTASVCILRVNYQQREMLDAWFCVRTNRRHFLRTQPSSSIIIHTRSTLDAHVWYQREASIARTRGCVLNYLG